MCGSEEGGGEGRRAPCSQWLCAPLPSHEIAQAHREQPVLHLRIVNVCRKWLGACSVRVLQLFEEGSRARHQSEWVEVTHQGIEADTAYQLSLLAPQGDVEFLVADESVRLKELVEGVVEVLAESPLAGWPIMSTSLPGIVPNECGSGGLALGHLR
mmetsp:Transcript_5122/g.12769  ORF Transcript_5122/g.12769 Transcript_5122/m.12769 type:complete len:156 (+) Transcript_5122:1214-1681(+)